MPQTYFTRFADVDDGELLDGYFENCLGTIGGPAGRIYIHNKLTSDQRWATYWHELMHALHDIAAWDAHKLRT